MELAQLGWNALTVSFVGTLFFSFLGALGLLDQQNLIWRRRSGRAVSTSWFISSCFMAVAAFIYGASSLSIALMFNGVVRFLPHIALLEGLQKFEGATPKEKALFLAHLIAITVMLRAPQSTHGPFFLLLSIGFLISLLSQPVEIARNGRGVASIRLLMIYIVSATFWVIYAISISDLFIFIFSSVSIAILLVAATLWIRDWLIDSAERDTEENAAES